MTLPGVFRRNLRLKAMAVAVALTVWGAVVYASNPPDTRTVSVPVTADFAGTRWTLDQPPDPLSVRVVGTKEKVAAFDSSHLSARLDATRITHDGLQDVPVVIVNTDPNVDLDSPPPTVRATVDVTATRQVPVTPHEVRTPPAGYLPRTPTITPGSVLVDGPKRVIEALSARVDIDLDGFKTNYERKVRVTLIDQTGQPVTTVGATPSEVDVEVIVDSAVTSRAVPVIVQPQGQVAPGHILGGLTATPQTVVLSGPQSVLNGIDNVTVPVSVVGLYGSVTVSGVAITLPEGVGSTPDRVDVRISVLAAPTPSPSPTASPTASPTPTPSPRSTSTSTSTT